MQKEINSNFNKLGSIYKVQWRILLENIASDPWIRLRKKTKAFN